VYRTNSRGKKARSWVLSLWSWSCCSGLGLKNLVLFTSLVTGCRQLTRQKNIAKHNLLRNCIPVLITNATSSLGRQTGSSSGDDTSHCKTDSFPARTNLQTSKADKRLSTETYLNAKISTKTQDSCSAITLQSLFVETPAPVGHKLRPRQHDRQLIPETIKLHNCNFIISMLYTHS